MKTLKYGKFNLAYVAIIPLLLSSIPSASQDIIPEKEKSNYFLKVNASVGSTNLFFRPLNWSSEIAEYTDKLNKCYHFSVDINYISNTTGYGIKLSQLVTSNSMENAPFTDDLGNPSIGFLQDYITINYLGPAILKQIWIGKQKSFVMNNQFSIGYIAYRNHSFMVKDYHITGNALGLMWDLGFDYLITKNIAAGVTVSAGYGKMKSFYTKEHVNQRFSLVYHDFEEALNVSRVDFEVGVKAYF